MEAGEASKRRVRWATLAGLACVYSGVPWLFALIGAVNSGWAAGIAAYAVCLAGTLAVGVGLCAGERWAWAAAVCLGAIYAAGALVVTAVLLTGMLTVRALSWQPVAAGLTYATAARVVSLALLVLAGSAGALALFWRAQGEFDVPHRRAFTTLLHEGALLAMVIIAATLFLLHQGWSALRVPH